MGNSQPSTRAPTTLTVAESQLAITPTDKSEEETEPLIDLSIFMILPIEIQLYTMTFLPMKKFWHLLLISKAFSTQLLDYNQLYSIYYDDFRKIVALNKRLWVMTTPESKSNDLPLKLEMIHCQNSGNQTFYKKLKQVVLDYKKEKKIEEDKLNEILQQIQSLELDIHEMNSSHGVMK